MSHRPHSGSRQRSVFVGIVTAHLLTTALAGASSAGFELTLKATRQVRSDEGGVWRVLLGLSVPLDQLFMPAPRQALGLGAPPEEGASSDAEAPEPAAPDRPDGAPAPRGSGPRAQRRAAALEPAPERGNRSRPVPRLDPALGRATVRAVMRARGRGASLDRLDELASRSNTSAWLPELRLSVGRSTDETLRLNPTIDDPYRYTQSGGSDLWGEVRLTWRLGRLIFTSDELSVERIRDQRVRDQEKLIAHVLELLIEWHRARLAAADPAALPEERDEARLTRLRAEMILDVLSEGWFSARISRAELRSEP